MKKAVGVTLVILAVWAAIIALGRGKKPGTAYGPDTGDQAVEGPRDRSFRKNALREVELTIADWPQLGKSVAHRMIEKYGVPDEVGRKALAWNDNGPWKRTIVHRDGARDALEQISSYHVGNDRYALIGRLPGSVSAERGRENLSSRSDNEALNFLALNLADEVLSGKRTIEGAQAEYDRSVKLVASGKSSPYTQSLLFAEPVAQPEGAPAAARPRSKSRAPSRETRRRKSGGRQ